MRKAASFAAAIEEALGTPVEKERGHRGQFEVSVDGAVVVERKGGLVALLTRRPWPSTGSVLAAVRSASGGDGGGG